GTFIGPIIEQSLRALGDAEALEDRAQAMEERFLQLSATSATAVRAYATLTLVRHVYLSTIFPDRRRFTERLIDLCEKRLDIAHHSLGWASAQSSHVSLDDERATPIRGNGRRDTRV